MYVNILSQRKSVPAYNKNTCRTQINTSKRSEAATRGALCEKVFLEISQNPQGNTCALGLQLYLKRGSSTVVFL